MSEFYIGVMSGTSLDGVDIAFCKIDSDFCELIHSGKYHFNQKLKEDILTAIGGQTTLKTIGHLDTRLGEMYADAIESFIDEKKIDKNNISAIGLHGQTLWHEPDTEFPFSMQLGNASVAAARVGVKVVCDFRQKDIALGGQGAPFTPAFHQFLFSKNNADIAVLNIGGMANLTILGDRLRGYDTGCGNVLMDMWIEDSKGEPYDKDGAFAKSGKANKELLERMLLDEYFKKAPPKSTGREYFNKTWLASYLPVFQTIKDEDIQATLLELTASSIANEVKKNSINQLIVCGGGVKNSFLMQRLQDKLEDVKVISSDELGVSSEFMEAMAFAWLACERVHRRCVKLSSVTGASKDSILGAIYE